MPHNNSCLCKIKPFSSVIPIVLYINLAHRKDRQREFLSNFPTNPPTLIRIDAVLNDQNGHIGCLRSHIKTLKYALEYYPNNEYICICEDDFYIPDMKYCEKMLSRFFRTKLNWDVLMLAHHTAYLDQTTFKSIIKIVDSQTTAGYVIKTSYIPKLLAIYERDLATFESTGIWTDAYCTDQSWKVLQRTDNWYSFLPRVAVQRESYSDIVKATVNYKA
jgi:hypothetical protein